MEERFILCVSSNYEQKFYLDSNFQNIPQSIKDELKVMCVLYTEEVGGILTLYFDDEGSLQLETEHDEEDILYDEIGAGLKMRQLQREKVELFEALEMYFRVFCLGLGEDDL